MTSRKAFESLRAFSEKVAKSDEIGGQKGPKINSKSSLGRPGWVQEAPGTHFDTFSGGFGSSQNFDGFWALQKAAKNRKIQTSLKN